MSDELIIQSYKGPYSVEFNENLLQQLSGFLHMSPHFIVDENIAGLYANELKPLLQHPNTILICAHEDNKSIERIIPVIEQLVANKVRRGDTLVAIGGGILQDITCYIASTLLRGLSWQFIPTTLLAQADSCIGSKSSINLGATKNILGTFNPPERIHLCTRFLDTLETKDVYSGVGEILKVHAIAGRAAFEGLAKDYSKLFVDKVLMRQYIESALRIKKKYIEVDEFDRGVRNIFNYGHSFGHAIESATHFGVPHGIAVSMGMDMANSISSARGATPIDTYHRMHHVLHLNYQAYAGVDIPVEALLAALLKDKKNTATNLVLILPQGPDANIERVEVAADDTFRAQCETFLEKVKNESH